MAEPQTIDDGMSEFLKQHSKNQPVSSSIDKPPAKTPDDGVSEFLRTHAATPTKQEQPQPPVTQKSSSGFLTTSVLKPVFGKSASEAYGGSSLQKAMEGIVPESKGGGDSQTFISKFLAEAYHAMPESLDFITSPAGLGLMALHTIPYARAVAPAVD